MRKEKSCKALQLPSLVFKMKISAIVLTKNEEGNIVDCLGSLVWCDEIIIIDDNSEDRTVELVENLKNSKIKIFERHLNNDFAAQRNFAFRGARNEWVLFVDTDERVSEALASEISKQILNKINGFYIRRRDFMWGEELKHGETGNIKLLRLAKKNAGIWVGKVHEKWKIKGEIGELKNPLLHYPHPTISEFLLEINFYSTIRSQELFDQKIKTSVWQIIIYPLGKFVVNYFLKLGFLDGIPGFLVGTLMSFHSFLVRAKLWNYTKRNQ